MEGLMKKSAANKKLSVSFERRPPKLVRWGSFTYQSIPLAIGVTEGDAICRVAFTRGKTPASVQASWKKAWPKTKFVRDQKGVQPFVKKIEAGEDARFAMIGTEFQCAVWQNLLRIPEGEVVTYAELARRSKRPKAVRAAGTACGANPVVIFVPCHRVIASDGSLGGFGGGLAVKKKLLKKENVEIREGD
jgi:O-6-methylguanine DNA methyltransferase